MNYYRLYYTGPDGKHFIDVRDFSAVSDEAAIVEAGSCDRGFPRELWNSGRKVSGLTS